MVKNVSEKVFGGIDVRANYPEGYQEYKGNSWSNCILLHCKQSQAMPRCTPSYLVYSRLVGWCLQESQAGLGLRDAITSP